MNFVKEFLKSKGEVVHSKVRFLNAGTPTMVPLEDLLEEFAGHAVVNGWKFSTEPAEVKKKAATGKTNKKKQHVQL